MRKSARPAGESNPAASDMVRGGIPTMGQKISTELQNAIQFVAGESQSLPCDGFARALTGCAQAQHARRPLGNAVPPNEKMVS
jgi:hypothetical protein